LAGIAPPSIRRLISTNLERQKQANDPRHPMYGQTTTISRLKSRKSFLRVSSALENDPSQSRINAWKDKTEDIRGWIEPAELLPPGHELQWHVWKTLNRLRVGVGRSKDNMLKWGYLNDQETSCHCGTIQTMAHLLVCPLAPGPCTIEDLTAANRKAIDVAQYWANENI